jgi:2-dehydropantoate 2-reductase
MTQTQRSRVAVMGAGAVGCFFGGMLARAGHEVMLIGRSAHVDAVNRDGLLLDGLKFRERVPAKASTDAAAVRGASLILFCVKSTDTEAAARQIAPHLGADAVILNLQNGVDNAERIRKYLPNLVIPAVVYVATALPEAGCVKHYGRGDLVIGDMQAETAPRARVSAALQNIVELFAGADVPVVISDNVTGDLWTKLVVNCAYNAISALGQAPYGEMIVSEGIRDVMRDVVDEVLAVAKASRVRMPDGLLATVYEIANTMAGQKSSTAQDVARGKPSEIDHLNGFVVRRGRELGVATPVNRTLHALVKLVEARPARSP